MCRLHIVILLKPTQTSSSYNSSRDTALYIRHIQIFIIIRVVFSEEKENHQTQTHNWTNNTIDTKPQVYIGGH